MALASIMAWEVRTTGSDTNGGGFVTGASGTDYSQQASAQFSGTDLVVDGAVNTKVTSATHNFVAADVGNVIQITAGAGWTTGFYQIVSTASNAATLDRSPAATGTTAGTWAEGGALLTLAKAFVPVDIAYNSNSYTHTIWMKAGTYTVTTATVIPATQGTVVEGYNTTRGDLGTKPLITTSTNSISMFTTTSNQQNGILFRNLNFSNTAATRGVGFYPNNGPYCGMAFHKCILDGFTYGVYGTNDSPPSYINYLIFVDTVIKNCQTDGVRQTGNTYFIGCSVHNNSSAGFDFKGGAVFSTLYVENSVFYSNGTSGMNLRNASNTAMIIKNSVFYSNTGDGVTVNSAQQRPRYVFINNIFDSNGGYGLDNSEALTDITTVIHLNNAFRNNTSGASNNFPTTTNVTLTADPFTNAAAQDFSLNSTAGGGAACKAAGYQVTVF